MNSRLYNFLIICLAIALGYFLAYKMFHIPKRMEFVILLGALLFYPVFRQPIFGLYAIFILSPFIPFVRRLYYLVYHRPGVDPLIIIGDVFLVFILAALLFEFKEIKSSNLKLSRYFNIIIFYFLYVFIRAFVFNFLPLSSALAQFKFYGPPALFFLVGLVYAYHLTHIKRFWYITIFICILASVYGYYQLRYGFSKAEMIWFSSIEFTSLFIQGLPRPFSIFQSPVAFADYALLGILGILMALQWSKTKTFIILMPLIPFFIYAALITSVRSNWLGLILIFLLWFFLINIKGNAYRVVVLSILLLLFIGYQFIQESLNMNINILSLFSNFSSLLSNQQYFDMLVSERATALTDPFQEHSFLSRINLWREIFIYSKEPLMALAGRGVGAFRADSLYVTYLAEFGYPGFVFIIVLMGAFIIRGFQLVDTCSNREVVTFAKGIVVMNICFAIISITGTHIHYFPGDIYFWFFNGVLIRLAIDNKENAGALQTMA